MPHADQALYQRDGVGKLVNHNMGGANVGAKQRLDRCHLEVDLICGVASWGESGVRIQNCEKYKCKHSVYNPSRGIDVFTIFYEPKSTMPLTLQMTKSRPL